MSTALPARAAPWSLGAGALVVWLALTGPAGAQEPPVPPVQPGDTIVADTAISDSTRAALERDSLAVDTLPAPDSLIFENLPMIPAEATPDLRLGVFEWDREALLRMRGFTLEELLSQVVGLLPVRGGDYGAPTAATGFGLTGGRVRVRVDGVERVALDGGVPDLSLIGLVGLDRVRVHRGLTDLVVELDTHRFRDGRAYSLIEAGTGDLDTNLFRGTFALPRAAGGSVVVGIERVDTQGPNGDEPGARTGAWLRYQVQPIERLGLGFDFRRGRTRRGDLYVPFELTRTDWALRARAQVSDSVVVGAHFGRARLDGADQADLSRFRGGRTSQFGLSADASRRGVWARGSGLWFEGDGLPGSSLDLGLGYERPSLGAATGDWRRESWESRSTSRWSIRARTRALFGLSLFGEWGSGAGGVPFVPRPAEATPDSTDAGADPDSVAAAPDSSAAGPQSAGDSLGRERFVDRGGRRLGVAFSRWGLDLSVARLRIEADSLVPFGLPWDADAVWAPGGERTGLEAQVSVPIPILDGLWFRGWMVRWSDAPDAWPNLPDLSYDARLHFHDVFLPTGNLELSVDLGIQEREGMDVFTSPVGDPDPDPGVPGLAAVPFFQSWYGRIQVRVITVNVFVGWDNFTLRLRNQDVPGRILPRTRAVYGVRWTLWN